MNIKQGLGKAILLVATLLTVASQARAGNGSSGGGDMCENRVQAIRDDLEDWINNGGHTTLNLPVGITSNQYANTMLGSFGSTQIKCVGEGDPGFPVIVGNTPKVCRFDTDQSGNRITCDYKKFMAPTSSESHQYVLIHHEYAGISQFELPNDDESSYLISNQISSYLVNTLVKKLSVRRNGQEFLRYKEILPTVGSFIIVQPEVLVKSTWYPILGDPEPFHGYPTIYDNLEYHGTNPCKSFGFRDIIGSEKIRGDETKNEIMARINDEGNFRELRYPKSGKAFHKFQSITCR